MNTQYKRASVVQAVGSQSADVFDYPSEDEKNVPPDNFNAYAKCFFGPKAIGKTTLAASFPRSLTLMFEPKRLGLSIRQLLIPKVTPKDLREGATDVWLKVLRTTEVWINDPSIECLNFDSVDIFYECCCASVFHRNKVNHPDDLKNGSHIWNQVRDEWAAYFSALRETRLGNFNLLSHIKDREEKQLDGSKMKGIRSPSASPACVQYIRQVCDFVICLGKHNGIRAALVRDPSDQSFVGISPENRFMQPDGKPIYVLEMPDILKDPTTPYDRLNAAFHNQCWDMDTLKEDRVVPDQPQITWAQQGTVNVPAMIQEATNAPVSPPAVRRRSPAVPQ